MLTVHVQSSPPRVTLLCHGRIVMGVEAETLRCIATSRAERRVVVDMQQVYGLDAAGLGLLVELHCWARERGDRLALAHPSASTRRLLALTGLDSVLEIEGSAAGQEFAPQPERSAMTA